MLKSNIHCGNLPINYNMDWNEWKGNLCPYKHFVGLYRESNLPWDELKDNSTSPFRYMLAYHWLEWHIAVRGYNVVMSTDIVPLIFLYPLDNITQFVINLSASRIFFL